jgi:hypothetical protein
MEDPAVKAVTDSRLMHEAPVILREMGTFAYRGGLIFEGELLHQGGTKMAFAGAFARSPRNSHEVLQPEAYIRGEKLPPLAIPDLEDVLDNEYHTYDSGGIGELDVRALLKQYGERKVSDEVSSEWQGGADATFRRKDDKDKAAAEASPATADLALLYISRWKTAAVAEWFAGFYRRTVAERYHRATAQSVPACSGADCPVSMVQIETEEGPVIVEQRKDNRVVVSESFDPATAARLRSALGEGAGGVQGQSLPQEEIGSKLLELPAFRAFADQIGERIAEEMNREARR